MLDYWTPTNPTNEQPRPNENLQHHLQGSTLRYRDGSLLRLRQLTLGYKIPKNVLRKTFLTNARIYITGENLWYWTKSELDKFNIEPESTGSLTEYPALRTFIVGININF